MTKPNKQNNGNLSVKSQQPLKEVPTDLEKLVIGILRQEFSGPLPPPNVLEKYAQIIPNGAERIMAMAEKQSDHRRALETKALNTDARNSFLGVVFAFLLGLTTIIAGVIVIILGYSWPGTIIGSAGLVGLVSAFIYGTNQRRKERETKAKDM